MNLLAHDITLFLRRAFKLETTKRKKFIKTSIEILTSYLSILLIFVLFLYVFLSFAKDNYSKWIPFYSFIHFLLLYILIYPNMKKTAQKEKKYQQHENQAYPLKGFWYGVVGFSPFILISLLYVLYVLYFGYLRPVEVAYKTLIGPIYWVARVFGLTIPGYVICLLVVPIIAGIAYLFGYYDIDVLKKLGKKQPEQAKPFRKSPWNPSVKQEQNKKKKKN